MLLAAGYAGLARAQAADVVAQAVNLPAGPASLDGFGVEHDVSPATGLPSLSIPVGLPAARGEMTIPFGLQYQPGAGAGPVGLDWTLGLPALERSTRQGVPAYAPDDPLVLRGLGGGEELVSGPGAALRTRIESGSPVEVRATSGGYEARAVDGTRYRFAPGEFGALEAPFRWNLVEMEDGAGNVVTFHWASEEPGGRSLLRRISYNDGAAGVVLEYEDRPDTVRSSRSGRPVELHHRVARIVTEVEEAPVRIHTLHYVHPDGVPSSMLARVEVEAWDGTQLPPWTLQYRGIQGEGRVTELAEGPALDPTAPGMALVDVDGDALPDLLEGRPGGWRFRRNLGGEAFAAWGELPSSPSVDLAGAHRLADVNADGVADVVVRHAAGSDGLRAFLGGGERPYGSTVAVPLPVGFDLSDPKVMVADVNLDGRADVLRAEAGETMVWLATESGSYLEPERHPGLPAGLMPERDGVRLVDVDGDRLPDLVRIDPDERGLMVARAVGVARWEAPVRWEHTPALGDASRWHLRDINGDGAADLVRTGRTQLEIWVNTLDGRFNAAVVLPWADMDTDEVVTFLDMNASGTLDVLRVDPTTGHWRVWDPMGVRPGLLTRVENGLGWVTSLRYRPAASLAHEAERAGNPWTTTVPVPVPVLASTVESDHTGFARVVDWRVRDGFYDAARGEFRGFSEIEEARLGDETTRDRIRTRRFDLGASDEARKNLLLEERIADDEGLLRRTVHSYTVNAEGEVSVARRAATDVWHEESASGRMPRRVRTEYDWDGWGNIVAERELGEVDAATGTDLPGDERIVARTYATSELGPRDRVSEETVLDGEGRTVGVRRIFYDGEPGQGLALGVLERGLVSREREWVAGEHWVDVLRREHDEHGNVVWEQDGVGKTVTWAFDPTGVFPVAETHFTGAGGTGRALAFEYEWNMRVGRPSRVKHPDGVETRFEYDGLGRLVAKVEPGDSVELPTASYDYALETGNPALVTRRRSVTGEPGVETEVSFLDGVGRPYQRLTEDDAGDGAILAEATVRGPDGEPSLVTISQAVDGDHLRSQRPVDLTGAELGTRTVRDGLGRALETALPDGRTAQDEYAPLVRIHRDHEDLVGGPDLDAPRMHESDGLGRLRRIVDVLPGGDVEHLYTHDPEDRVIAYTDPAGWETVYRYDGRGALVEVDSPDAGIIEQRFDDAGRLLERVDAEGAVVLWERDALGRSRLEVGFSPDGRLETQVTRTYDVCAAGLGDPDRCAGHLATVHDDAGQLTVGYDARGRADRWHRRFAGSERSLAYGVEHDAQGRLRVEHFPGDVSVERHYSARGLLGGVHGFVDGIDRDPQGGWVRMDLANGVTQTRNRDPMGRVLEHGVAGQGGDLWHLSYEYDAAGLLARVRDHVGATSESPRLDQVFEHDSLHRLVRANGDYGELTWDYDSQGNLLRHGGLALQYAPSHPHAVTALGGQSLGYDAAGRLRHIEGDGPLTPAQWVFDAQSRLRTVTMEDGRRVESTYDHEGVRAIRRVYRGDELESETLRLGEAVEIVDGELVRWLFVDGERLVEWRAPVPDDSDGLPPLFGGFLMVGARRRRRRGRSPWLALGGGALIGAGCGGASGSEDGAPHGVEVRFHINDRVGTLALVVDGDGEVVARHDGDPHGASPREPGESGGTRWQFAGHLTVRDEGLVIAGVRAYLPALGRFASPDPLPLERPLADPGRATDFDPYGYAAGNPTDRVDPDGRASQHVGVRLTGSGAVYRVAATVSLVTDDRGGAGLSITLGAGPAAGVEAGVSVVAGGTTANRIGDLQGKSVRIGGSAGAGVRGGLDVIGAGGFGGAEVSVGVGGGAEIHESTEFTGVLDFGGVRDAFESAAALLPGREPEALSLPMED